MALNFWTAEEYARACELRAAGVSHAAIGAELGRSADSVSNRFTRERTSSSFTTHWWTPDREARLAELWSKGLSARQIGDEMAGPSRNAIIAKARRLGLAARRSPIIRDGRPRRRAKPVPQILLIDRELTAQTLGPAPAEEDDTMPADVAPDTPDTPDTAGARPGDRPYSARHCQYPRGSRPHYDFCPAMARAGSAYCGAHHTVCWTAPAAPPKAPYETAVRRNRSLTNPGLTAFT